jgi:3-methyladenine DNA glycosylase AlkD
MHPMVEHLTNEMKRQSDPEKAAGMQASLKTDQPFYSVQSTPRRKIFRDAVKAFDIASREEYERVILELCHEQEFFIRKAIGWILRDYSYTNPDRVKRFVNEHEDSLSGLSMREALKQINRKSS